MTKTVSLHEAFGLDIANLAAGWLDLWGVPNLTPDVQVRFSSRMYRAVGRCYPARRVMAFAAAVQEMPQRTVCEVLCHELAHMAAFELFGPTIKPHGVQWKGLMQAAGYPPAVTFRDPASIDLLRRRAPVRTGYLHRCPRCRASRISNRRMRRWRCGPCYEIGFDGQLEITRVQRA